MTKKNSTLDKWVLGIMTEILIANVNGSFCIQRELRSRASICWTVYVSMTKNNRKWLMVQLDMQRETSFIII